MIVVAIVRIEVVALVLLFSGRSVADHVGVGFGGIHYSSFLRFFAEISVVVIHKVVKVVVVVTVAPEVLLRLASAGTVLHGNTFATAIKEIKNQNQFGSALLLGITKAIYKF
jgi:hypothetical protein